MVAKDVKGCVPGWLEENEMWSRGWKSFVAMRIAKPGRDRRLLTVGAMSRPEGTAREPFCRAQRVSRMEW